MSRRKCSVCKKEDCDRRKHNFSKTKDLFKDFIFPFIKSTKNALDNELTFVKQFNSDIEFRKEIGSRIGLNLDHATCYKINKESLPNDRVKQSDIWKKLKVGTGERSPSSKSDLCIINGDKKVTISLKSGKCRMATGDYFECNAIFVSVLQSNEIYNEDETLKEYISTLIQIMKDLGKQNLIHYKNKSEIDNKLKQNPDLEDEDIIWLKKYKKVHKECMNIWNKLIEKYPEYIEDVLFECISGSNKFENKIGKAEWLIQTKSSDSTEIKEIFKLDKRTTELDDYLMKCLPCITSIFAIKSSGPKLWQRLF